MDDLDALTETAAINHPIPHPQLDSASRRRFLTGKLDVDPATKTELVAVERPLSPSLRYGLSQALLTALAAVREVTLTELIAVEFNLPFQPALTPMHLDINGAAPAPDASVLSKHIQSLGYRIGVGNPKERLGSDGAKLQRFIRELTDLIERVTEPDYRPAIHLDVAGGLGQIYEDNVGRILGALYGLEQAAQPYPLCISDPVSTDDPDKQIEIRQQLLDFIRLRGMRIRLGVRSPLRSLADVQRFAATGAAHLLELSLPQLGTIQQSIRAIHICRQAGMAVLLRDDGNAPQFACHASLAAQPDLLAVSWDAHERRNLDQMYAEMARTVAWINRNHA
jgi:methylaspartate ammonia-lyase